MPRTIILSNRVPSMTQGGACGGLAAGLEPALTQCGGLWLGWSGKTSPAAEGLAEGALSIERTSPFTLATLDLGEAEYRGYYAQFSNQVLWPLLHGQIGRVRHDAESFATYRAVNEKFAKVAAALARPGDMIWVHDYHLFHAGTYLRAHGFSGPIGFFLHTPFPSLDVWATLPSRDEILTALAAYDVVGFQTENDLRNFREVILHQYGGAVGGDGSVFLFGRKFKADTFPIGIDADKFSVLAASATEDDGRDARPRTDHRDIRVVGVDRLDYTKGLPKKLLAFERFLETSSDLAGRARLTQIAAPSREGIPEYAAAKWEAEALARRINARFPGTKTPPIEWINKALPHDNVAALYRHSDVALVTPLRDGMNLVAKEFVAAQDPRDPGVLILSEFAGAAEYLEGAVRVNPYDTDAVADALRRSVAMPRTERAARWQAMAAEIHAHDIHHWHQSFLSALGGKQGRRQATTGRAAPTPRFAPADRRPIRMRGTVSSPPVARAGQMRALSGSGHVPNTEV